MKVGELVDLISDIKEAQSLLAKYTAMEPADKCYMRALGERINAYLNAYIKVLKDKEVKEN